MSGIFPSNATQEHPSAAFERKNPESCSRPPALDADTIKFKFHPQRCGRACPSRLPTPSRPPQKILNSALNPTIVFTCRNFHRRIRKKESKILQKIKKKSKDRAFLRSNTLALSSSSIPSRAHPPSRHHRKSWIRP